MQQYTEINPTPLTKKSCLQTCWDVFKKILKELCCSTSIC